MARVRSPLAAVFLAAVALSLVPCLLRSTVQPSAFLPGPAAAPRAAVVRTGSGAAGAAVAVALATAAAIPLPAFALEDEEEGFDLRILAVLALPLTAISWALFNVWRVAFRQVIRIGESESGSSAQGLGAED
mmetsp:Transcript_34392/g.102768  ORF Transcript_34392/g.102768 Transcript_34392/m.102768 type:complete len:132 (+) Transcript_34392:73-468(+)